MGTFNNTYGPDAMMAAVANAVREVEIAGNDVHTVTLVLNGQHGEFDLVVEATKDDADGLLEDVKFEGIAHRYGGVAGFKEVEV